MKPAGPNGLAGAFFFFPFGNLMGCSYAVTLLSLEDPSFGRGRETMIWAAIQAFSRKSLILLAIGISCASAVWAGEWTVLGPEGGDVRSLSYDPRNPDHIYLGTGTGTMFLSEDGGHNWSRFAHLGDGDE